MQYRYLTPKYRKKLIKQVIVEFLISEWYIEGNLKMTNTSLWFHINAGKKGGEVDLI